MLEKCVDVLDCAIVLYVQLQPLVLNCSDTHVRTDLSVVTRSFTEIVTIIFENFEVSDDSYKQNWQIIGSREVEGVNAYFGFRCSEHYQFSCSFLSPS